MKSILHFSDIHFGAPHAPDRAAALLEEIERLSPSVVAVSGDLTQRARSAQFRRARAFLDQINAPLIVVPGNHDVPLWNVYARFSSPLEKYRRWITPELNPTYRDDYLAVLGLDSTRSFTIKGGRIDDEDLRAVRERLRRFPEAVCKVIVTHHPLVLPPGFERESVVSGASRALDVFEECGVEIILTGHLHQTYITSTTPESPRLKRSILIVQAGTAATFRGRGSEQMKNSLNLIEVSGTEIRVIGYIYSTEENRFLAGIKHVSPRHV
ncbi:MAG TPA: metallophosphoesterase [Blastocatellia bacterium]|nr:metallophosphoesterase [Blastocatellia bacterium]